MNPAPRRDAQLVVRLAADDLAKVDKFAGRLDLSRSEAVRQLLRLGLGAVGQTRSRASLLDLLSNIERPPRRR